MTQSRLHRVEWLLILTVVVAALWKGMLLAWGPFSFNADEAVVALMARHILAGARPLFFYGQFYMGSLDAGLVALGFALFGEDVLVIRVVQGLLYLGTVATTGLLAIRIIGSRRAGLAAGLLMAIPTVNVTLYTTVSLGGYGEALLLGNLLLLLSLRLRERPEMLWMWAAWGVVAGLGFWAFGLIVAYALPALLYVLWPRKSVPLAGKRWLRPVLVIGGAAVGASPWLLAAAQTGLAPLLTEMVGSAIAGASPQEPLAAAASHLFSLLVLGTTVIFGLRPPWEVRWLAMPLLPLAVVFWLSVLAHGASSLPSTGDHRGGRVLVAGLVLAVLAGFVLAPFGADPSGRYFLPLAAPLAVFAGGFVSWLVTKGRAWMAWGLLTAVLAFHAAGTIECALRNPPGLTTQFDSITRIDHRHDQALMAFLFQQGERRGYTNYWVAYPLAFLSHEELIFVPGLPYHQDLRYTSRDDRYPEYDPLVDSSEQVAYITTHHPILDDLLRRAFTSLGVTWREAVFGDYRLFYDLSRPVRPSDVSVGE